MTSLRTGRIAGVLATWFGCGLVPVGPGTAGAVGAIAVAWVLEYCGVGRLGLLVLTAALTPVGVWAADVAARSSGRKDPAHVVIDEVLGQWLALLGAGTANPVSWGAAFVLFRLFDIFKPPPVRQLERLPGGVGIVADDLMAGAYSALVLFGMGCFNLY